MKARSVLGSISPSNIGITLPHEHVLCDLSKISWEEPSEPSIKKFVDVPVDITFLGILRRNPRICKDNLRLDNLDLAVNELSFFKDAGGSTIVDLTNVSLGRDVKSLSDISKRTGVNIIAGCGYYTETSHPDYVKDWRAEDIANEIIKDLDDGIGNTGIKAGIIGEIGLSEKPTKNEKKVLKAAAKAQKDTNAAINIHTPGFVKIGFDPIKTLEREGADLNRVIVSHLDILRDLIFQKKLAGKGVYIEYEHFGQFEWLDYCFDKIGILAPQDCERVMDIKKLIKAGYLNRILVSTDVCKKMNLKRYGGYGYDHILKNIVPMMKKVGIGEEEIGTIMVLNPQRILAF